VGYSLTMLVTPSSHPNDVLAFVREHVPQAKVQSNIGAELSILLPRTAAKYFPALLTALDGALERLGVRSYGITQVRASTQSIRVCEQSFARSHTFNTFNVLLRH
jgi:ATP-binding cassette subfamily A (ABC1) protein 3